MTKKYPWRALLIGVLVGVFAMPARSDTLQTDGDEIDRNCGGSCRRRRRNSFDHSLLKEKIDHGLCHVGTERDDPD